MVAVSSMSTRVVRLKSNGREDIYDGTAVGADEVDATAVAFRSF